MPVNPSDPKLQEALNRVAYEKRYYREFSIFGQQLHQNIGKTIRIRLAHLIYVASNHPRRYETICACEWFIQQLQTDMLSKFQFNNEVTNDIQAYILILRTIILDFENIFGKVDPHRFGHIISASDSTPELFVYGWTTDAWGNEWNNTSEYQYGTPNGKLTVFSNDFLTH